jgi:hypothetical protein
MRKREHNFMLRVIQDLIFLEFDNICVNEPYWRIIQDN